MTDILERYDKIRARTSKGIEVHQGCVVENPPTIGSLREDNGQLWLVFDVYKVDGGWFWDGQDPDSVPPLEDPCDNDFMREISS